jgi:hypothetical protein
MPYRFTALAGGFTRLQGGYVMSMYVCTKSTNEEGEELRGLGGDADSINHITR